MPSVCLSQAGSEVQSASLAEADLIVELASAGDCFSEIGKPRGRGAWSKQQVAQAGRVAQDVTSTNAYQCSGGFVVGMALWWANDAMLGAIDDLRLWQSARTDAEIQASMNFPMPPAQGGMDYRFDEGIGTSSSSTVRIPVLLQGGVTWKP